MSYSTLLRVYKTKALWDVELKDSRGSASVAWGYLCDKYLNGESFLMNEPVLHKLFKMIDGSLMEPQDKAALLLTADRCVFLKQHTARAAKDLCEFAKRIGGEHCGPKQYVNHWHTIAEQFAVWADAKADHRLIGYALNCTSCSDCWDDYPAILYGSKPILCDSSDIYGESK